MRLKINSLQQTVTTMKSKPVKNVILFVGDGMGATVLTGARIYRSQKETNVTYQEPFEFEKFPFSGLSKVLKQCFTKYLHFTGFFNLCRHTVSIVTYQILQLVQHHCCVV